MAQTPESDPACDVAHGTAEGGAAERTLVAVFASPVAAYLLRYGHDLGFSTVLVEPDPERARTAGAVTSVPELDETADIVVTDHHREELGEVLRDALAQPARWIGVLGNPRHEGPHVAALEALGVPAADIARVHRPVGLNIGSRTPAEIAIATLAGLLADRNGRPGGFEF
ncbi:xanthine dehydrogenase [Prauserella sp. PE36]|uniref:Xanthine dehydrogenase n=1 Tax=Prauserella endophytica TaxID=1592324 RepID=A0ABY2RXW2_9PSEU|nr:MULTISPECIES: XdhC family protein [Prauserella]PXY23703.1 xanthine dehydrogenase [Prauserella coralliicola]RBM16758.1 xanthine dehydrogenase [Prauserella sp. PE36]TKG64905.1 xanthine dehydrogenase [Prauserella endophytica]